jgi:hypothetical protein
VEKQPLTLQATVPHDPGQLRQAAVAAAWDRLIAEAERRLGGRKGRRKRVRLRLERSEYDLGDATVLLLRAYDDPDATRPSDWRRRR